MILGKKDHLVGLDIGSRTIKAAEIVESKKGRVLKRFGMTDIAPGLIEDGAINQPEEVGEAIRVPPSSAGGDGPGSAGLPQSPVSKHCSTPDPVDLHANAGGREGVPRQGECRVSTGGPGIWRLRPGAGCRILCRYSQALEQALAHPL